MGGGNLGGRALIRELECSNGVPVEQADLDLLPDELLPD